MHTPIKSKPARPSPPPIARAGAEIVAALAKKTKYVDPALAEHWPTIAGVQIAALCRPGRLLGHGKGRTLEAYAPSAAAAVQLEMLANALLERVNRYLGPGAVTKINIRQGGPFQAHDHGPGGGDPLDRALSSFRAAVNRRTQEK